MPETSTDIVKDPDRRSGAEFAKRPDMPSMSGGPWPRSGLAHRGTRAEQCLRSVRAELGGAWTSSEKS